MLTNRDIYFQLNTLYLKKSIIKHENIIIELLIGKFHIVETGGKNGRQVVFDLKQNFADGICGIDNLICKNKGLNPFQLLKITKF